MSSAEEKLTPAEQVIKKMIQGCSRIAKKDESIATSLAWQTIALSESMRKPSPDRLRLLHAE